MKRKQTREKSRLPAKEEDVLGEVRFEIGQRAFKGPFRCCNLATRKKMKRVSFKGIEFQHSVWYCAKCKKEYLDSEQAKRLEKFWTIERILNDDLITMERSMNYDGKTYFFRFPKELTKGWKRKSVADIKLINPETFLVEVKEAVRN